MGRKIGVGAGCVFTNPGGLSVGARTYFEHAGYCKLVNSTARLRIGEYCFLGRGVEFDVLERVTVGDHVLIAPGCFITDHTHGIDPGLRINQQPCTSKSVTIGNDVWLGAGVVVLAGVTIGEGAVVGANSVVTRDVMPMTVVAGSPAVEIRKR